MNYGAGCHVGSTGDGFHLANALGSVRCTDTVIDTPGSSKRKVSRYVGQYMINVGTVQARRLQSKRREPPPTGQATLGYVYGAYAAFCCMAVGDR